MFPPSVILSERSIENDNISMEKSNDEIVVFDSTLAQNITVQITWVLPKSELNFKI